MTKIGFRNGGCRDICRLAVTWALQMAGGWGLGAVGAFAPGAGKSANPASKAALPRQKNSVDVSKMEQKTSLAQIYPS